MIYTEWRKLPMHTRQKIASHFGIIRTGSVEVFNNQINSDGYPFVEIEAKITPEALQSFLGTKETDFSKLWTAFVDLMEDRLPQVEIEPAEPIKIEIQESIEKVEEKPKRNVKTKTKAKK